MRRLFASLAGAAGGAAAYRLLRRRRAASQPAAGPDPRAGELRARLDESRREPAAEPAAAPAPGPEKDGPLDERRRRVHEQGRTALDEMQAE